MNTRRIRWLATLGVLAPAAYLLAVRPWHLRWGAAEDELLRVLPGDDLVPEPKLQSTRAITIHAPADAVWPWLLQIGQGRGGLYSYDWLENLGGLDLHSADRIIPELQHLAVGDSISLAPNNAMPLRVAWIEPNRALVLHTSVGGRLGNRFAFSWTWVLDPIDAEATRLIARVRLDWDPSLRSALIWRGLTEPAQFVMERKMLQGIKARAELAQREVVG